MKSLEKLNCLKFYPKGTKFTKEEGYKFTKSNMIFDQKQKYLQHKSILLVGGNLVDFNIHNNYSYSVQNISVSLLLLIEGRENLSIITGGIGN